MSQVAHQAGAYPGFCSMKQLGVFLLSPGWDGSLMQGYPQHGTHLYIWVKRGTVRVKCLDQKHNVHNVPGRGLNMDCLIWRQAH